MYGRILKIGTLIALLGLILTPRAFAIWGRVDHQSTAVCAIETSSRSVGAGTCTGVKIAPNVIQTAAHCVRESMSVFCPGNVPVTLSSRQALIHKGYDAQEMKKNIGLREYDVAHLVLDEPLSGDFIPVPKTRDHFVSIASQGRCFLAGYGPQGVKARLADSVNFSNVELELKGGTWVLTEATYALVEPGDSGGPMYCADAKGWLWSMGVISGRSFEMETLVAGLLNHLGWIQNNLSGIEALDDPADLAQAEFNKSYIEEPPLPVAPEYRTLNDFIGVETQVKPYSLVHSSPPTILKRVSMNMTTPQQRSALSTVDNELVKIKVEAVHGRFVFGRIEVISAPSKYLCDPGVMCPGTYYGWVHIRNLER